MTWPSDAVGRAVVCWLGAAALVAVPGVCAAQTADPKAAFLQALSRFSLALDGSFGDEGPVIHASLDELQRGLGQWDAAVAAYERGMRAEVGAAAPELAARMHLALGGVYLDRGRVDDALRELGAASRLDASLADVHRLRGLVFSQMLGKHLEAAAAFRQALALDPRSPVLAYLLARHLVQTGDDAAAASARAIVRASYTTRGPSGSAPPVAPFLRLQLVPESEGVEPFFPPARYAAGFALLRQGDYPAALAAFRAAAANDPLTAGSGPEAAPMAEASAAFRDGDVDGALRHLDRSVARAPDRGEPHRLRGMVLLAGEQHEAAVTSLRAAVRLAPADERSRLALAEALLTLERPVEAGQTLRETIDAIPASGRARYLLARALERQGRYADAIRALEESVTFGPLIAVNAIYETIGALHLARQDVAAAQAAFEQRVDLSPNDAGAHHALGDAYARDGRFDEALAEFAIAAWLAPSSTVTHVSIAQTHLAEGEYEGALAAAQRALASEPRHKEAQYVLATALTRLGRAEEGARALEVFSVLQAEEAAAKARQFELGTLRREAALAAAQQDHAREVALLRRAATLDPASPAAHLDLGLALLRAGQPGEAVEAISHAIVAGAGAEAYRHLAEAYRVAGKADESRRAMAVADGLRRDALRRAGATR